MTDSLHLDVRLLLWPQHADERAWCRQHRIPRILLVQPGQQPPYAADTYEDWVRHPVPPEDLRFRARSLAMRKEADNRPQIDPHGSLTYRGQRISISPTQVDLISCLARAYGEPVLRSVLTDCMPGNDRSTTRRNVLDLHIGRLRRRIAPLGLNVRTVWGCGYVLEPEDGPVSPDHHVGVSS